MKALLDPSVVAAFGDPVDCNFCGHGMSHHHMDGGRLRCTEHRHWTHSDCNGPRVQGPDAPYGTLTEARGILRRWEGLGYRGGPATMLFLAGEAPSFMAAVETMGLARRREYVPFGGLEDWLELRQAAEIIIRHLP